MNLRWRCRRAKTVELAARFVRYVLPGDGSLGWAVLNVEGTGTGLSPIAALTGPARTNVISPARSSLPELFSFMIPPCINQQSSPRVRKNGFFVRKIRESDTECHRQENEIRTAS